jgi:excisionase family DNA binding protein
MDETTPPQVTPRQVSEAVGVSIETVRRWMRSGQLASVRIGGRLRTSWDNLKSFMTPVAGSESVPAIATSGVDHAASVRNIACRFGKMANKSAGCRRRDA